MFRDKEAAYYRKIYEELFQQEEMYTQDGFQKPNGMELVMTRVVGHKVFTIQNYNYFLHFL